MKLQARLMWFRRRIESLASVGHLMSSKTLTHSACHASSNALEVVALKARVFRSQN